MDRENMENFGGNVLKVSAAVAAAEVGGEYAEGALKGLMKNTIDGSNFGTHFSATGVENAGLGLIHSAKAMAPAVGAGIIGLEALKFMCKGVGIEFSGKKHAS